MTFLIGKQNELCNNSKLNELSENLNKILIFNTILTPYQYL